MRKMATKLYIVRVSEEGEGYYLNEEEALKAFDMKVGYYSSLPSCIESSVKISDSMHIGRKTAELTDCEGYLLRRITLRTAYIKNKASLF